MPRASDIRQHQKLRLLVYSITGGGKTTLFRSLPGRKFLYMFDPAGLCSLKPEDDIEFEEFVPDALSISVSTLKGASQSEVSQRPYEAYKNFESHYFEHLSNGFFGDFEWIGFDSITTLLDLIMDEIAFMYGRAGRPPELVDYGVAADTLKKIIRNATSQGCNIFFSGHERAQQDKLLRDISIQLSVPGQLIQKLPLLFSDIYHLKARRDGDKIEYFADTAPDDMYPLARCSLELNPTINVTIPHDCDDPTQYGLGKILREKGRFKD